MPTSIRFFPPSQPDETLNSRVSRYHLIAGNSTAGATLAELFGTPLMGLDQVVPPSIDVLAARIPGDPRANLDAVLTANTLLPLFQPFIGQINVQATQQGLISRLPRRVVGKHGEVYLCIQCIKEDEKDYGIGYWHRAHQAPGVSACWKHRSQLLSSCPICRLPFQRKYKLLDATWSACPQCSNNLFEAPAGDQCSDNAYRFATFVHDLLTANFPTISPDVLALTYRKQIQSAGFVRGSLTALGEFTESLVATLGEDFVREVDPAYANGRTSFWLRLYLTDGAMDMPITRHLLLSMHLFGTADRFLQAVRELLPIAGPATERKKSQQAISGANTTRDDYRKRIRHEIKLDPGATMEKLWKKAYRATAWLFENDKSWLSAALVQKTPPVEGNALAQSDEDKRQDQHFATLVDAHARKLITSKEKPQRVTLGRLVACLPITLVTLRRHEARYPILSEQLERCKESSWSFSARRVLWAIGEVNRLGMSVTLGNIVITSSVSYYVIRRILSFCRWDFAAMAAQQLNPADELTKVGIGPTWQGPDSSAINEVGGRSYVALTSRKSNRQIDLVPRPVLDGAASRENAEQDVPATPMAKPARAV